MKAYLVKKKSHLLTPEWGFLAQVTQAFCYEERLGAFWVKKTFMERDIEVSLLTLLT